MLFYAWRNPVTAIDTFEGFARRPAGGPSNLVEITPDDAADMTSLAHWIYVGTGGSLRITTGAGQTVTFTSILPGWHAIEVARVHATGTTATDLIAGW